MMRHHFQRLARTQRQRMSAAIIEALENRQHLSGSMADSATTLAAVPPRIMEHLGRGVVAVRSSSTQAFVSWRLLALDPAGIGFNLYRSNNGGAAVKLNSSVLVAGTNYTDTPPNLTQTNRYYVRPVIGGVEQPASGSYTLAANALTEPIVRVPITAPPAGYHTKSIWVGDLDGDGEFDYIADRLAPFYVDPVTGVENNDKGVANQMLEAYKRDGTKLWTIDLGLTSRETYNISPGAATVSMGMWDGVTVQDLNGDGKAEVILKIANGVKFPDGTTFTTTNDQRQFISVLDGMTGNKLAQLEFPTDHAFAGRLSTMLGVGYMSANGKPSIVAWLRNRNPDTSAYGSLRKAFNDIIMAWDWDGGSVITQKWKLLLKAGTTAAQGVAGFHQMRIVDVNLDGYDDVLPGNYAVSGKDGTIIYKLPGIEHGDRFHVGDFDPNRPGLEGYGIQQNDSHKGEANAILDYYYDATNGTILWTDNGVGYDVGRGAAGDVDPSKLGYEMWAFSGIHNGPTHDLVDDDSTGGVPWPNLRIWWDGDLGSEEMDGTVINKYNPVSKTTGRLVTGYKMGTTTLEHFPMFYGDIMGDWREEAIYMNSTWSELLIMTTNVPTTTRLYTLAEDPAYRSGLTVKGYFQSLHTDYYLGNGMTTPPTPNIVYANSVLSVQASTFLYDTAPTKLTFKFTSNVSANFGPEDLSIALAGGGTITPTAYTFDAATNTGTFTLPTALVDGSYTATLAASGFSGPSGSLLSGNYTFNFFVLMGDANHSGIVDSADFTMMSSYFNQTGVGFSKGDFNYDGKVNALDFNALASRYGTQAAPIAGPTAQATTLMLPASGSSPRLFSASPVADDDHRNDDLLLRNDETSSGAL